MLLIVSVAVPQIRATTNRSVYIPYDYSWYASPDFKWVAFDQIRQQIFVAWTALDRIDVLSAADYHTIRSIVVRSPSSLDISPDGTTLAVGTSSAHILFFDTGTFAKTNDVVFPDSALGITAFVYAGNGNAFVRAVEGLSTGGGITAYWDHVTNSFSNESNAEGAIGPYQTTGPLARSGDYSRIMLGDASSGGGVQIVDGNTGQVLQQLGFGGYILGLAANKDASRFAICAEPAGLGGFLIVLDSSFNEVYQDQAGCIGIAFSTDGNTLYRDAGGNTQAIDMTTFSIKNTANYFSQQSSGYSTQWQVADGTGMVYGLNPNIPNDTIFVAVDTTAASTPPIPPISDPVHVLRVIDNIGSPQGGDMIRILCTGVDTVSQSSVSVTIGGAAATGVTVSQVGAFPTLPNLRWVTVKTPPGTSGRVDVTLSASGKSDTLSKGFQYARTVKLFPFSSSPNFLLFDSGRQKLYAAHKDQVEVIDPIAQQVQTPIVPASGKLANSQFAGLSLSPDGNRLYVADPGANLVHELDLTHPGTGASVNPTTAVGSTVTLTPARVFETSTGTIVGSDVGGNLFTLNGVTGSGSWLTDQFGRRVNGNPWNSTNKGKYTFLGSVGDGLISSNIALWNASTSELLVSKNETQDATEASADEDGTVIAVGGSTPGISHPDAEIADFDLNSVGYIMQHYDVAMPTGTPSFFLHPSGALLYKAGSSAVGGSVEIDDVNQAQSTANITFPEPFVTSYSPFTDHMLTTDDTGRYLFGVTNSGITMMVLDTLPLSIGNVQPSFVPSSGGIVTVRGSGFASGAVASFGGVQAATTFVDENTLTAVVPTLAAGWQDVTVVNSNADSYTARGILQVLATQPTPVITGFSPAAAALSLGEEPIPITIFGSGFADYDAVEVNGEPVESAFVNSTSIQATIPYWLTGKTGSIPFTVVSPYTGTSNTLSIPLVNPVPAIDFLFPTTLVTGSSSGQFNVYGKNFAAGSVVEWNGQNLPTNVVGGTTNSGDSLLVASVPAGLLTNSGVAAITVFNPLPGGGTSGASSMDVSPAHPQVSYPAKLDFGTILLGTPPTTLTVQLENIGSANYTLSSLAIGSAVFSIQGNNCNNVGFSFGQNICIIQLSFSPTTAGTSNATLSITDNTAGSPHAIPITGIATQTLVPNVTLLSIDALGQTVSATLNGTATVGGPNIPAVAWIEYGTDPLLATFSKSAQWPFTGDAPSLSGSVTGLSPATTYAARLAVQTAGGVGKSNIGKFATMAAWPEVNLALAPGASNVATVSASQTATYQLLVSDGGNGYTGTASLSCSGAPTGATCTVTPASVNLGLNGVPVTVTVSTTGKSSALLRIGVRSPVWATGLLLIGMVIVPRRKRWSLGRLLCVALLALSVLGCGGGASGSPFPPPPPPPTPSGTYYLTVSATAGGVQTTYLLTLNVN